MTAPAAELLTDEQIDAFGDAICIDVSSRHLNALAQLIAQAKLANRASADERDAKRLQSMAREWDEWQKHLPAPNRGKVMPIWDALCDAIGEGSDGNGMRAAIDAALAGDRG